MKTKVTSTSKNGSTGEPLSDEPLAAHKAVEASQRATARMLGVSQDTIRLDLKAGENSPAVSSAPAGKAASEDGSGENSPAWFQAEVMAKRDALVAELNAFQEAIAEVRRRHAAAAVLHADMLTLGSRLHNRGMEKLAVSPSSVAVKPLAVDLPTLPTVARHLDRTLEAIADHVGSGTRLKSNKQFASKGHLFVNNGLTLNRRRAA